MAALSLHPCLNSPSSKLNFQGFATVLSSPSVGFWPPRMPMSKNAPFELNSVGKNEIEASTSDLAECFDELEVEEPNMSTMLINFESKFDPYGAMSTPIYQTATFKQPSATQNGPYDYTRSGNPTRDVLESLMEKLEKADRALCFTSGMAALAAVTRLIGTGEEIVAGDDIYGGSDRLLSQVVPKMGIVVKRVNMVDLEEVACAIGPKTKLVWLESPTNPRLEIFVSIC